jgi:membrane fusion protein (multidrug efflux system)
MAHPGRIKLTDVTVDQTTGSVTLRAVFPNPDAILLPGMYVRATVPQGSDPAALLAPQRGVNHDQSGKATAMIVDSEGKAQSRALETGRMVGNRWLVTKGLKAGDRVSRQQTLIAGRLTRSTNLVTLYKTLGGGID